MNTLIGNKKKAKRLSMSLGHKIKSFYMVSGFALARCSKCGRMVYVSGRYRTHLYGKRFSGDALNGACPGRVLSVDELAENYTISTATDAKYRETLKEWE